MHTFSTRFFVKLVLLLMVMSVITTPVQRRKHERSNGLLDKARAEPSRKRLKTEVASKPADPSESRLGWHKIVLRRQEQESLKLIPLEASITADEVWTVAIMNEASQRSNYMGYQTHRTLENGIHKWKQNLYVRPRNSEFRRLLYVKWGPANNEYEELGRVEMSLSMRQRIAQANIQVRSDVPNTIYCNYILTKTIETITRLKVEYPTEVGEIVFTLSKWDWDFYSRMVNLKGSGTGFTITEEKHPDEWKLYLEEAEKLRESGVFYVDDDSDDEDSTLRAMNAALFGNTNVPSLSGAYTIPDQTTSED
ncbi:hypothetical protein F5880DRAFT_1213114 [Lentinula raphanica]|nr:hypothetical protein F5880DRAFT_1213114 [Lentinula raphanica]